MTVFQTLDEIAHDHWRRCADEARRLYRRAVRPVFQRTPDGRPELIGSSVLVEIDHVRYLATAAHVPDGADEASLHLGARSDVIPLNATFEATVRPENDRLRDDIDVAVAALSRDQLDKLEGVPFIEMSAQLPDIQIKPGQFFLAIGFRASQNKVPRPATTNLPLTMWSYKGLGAELPKPNERQFRGAYNFAVEYPKRALRSTGEVVRTTPPKGISGGAIFQLGDLTDLGQLGSTSPHPPKLAGIVVECPKGNQVLIGAKVQALRYASESARERA